MKDKPKTRKYVCKSEWTRMMNYLFRIYMPIRGYCMLSSSSFLTKQGYYVLSDIFLCVLVKFMASGMQTHITIL
jgi:hypothetical protein